MDLYGLIGESVTAKTAASITTKFLLNDKDQQIHAVGYALGVKSAVYDCFVDISIVVVVHVAVADVPFCSVIKVYLIYRDELLFCRLNFSYYCL